MTLSDIERLVLVRDNEEQELTEWEDKFVRSCIVQLERKNSVNGLSSKQIKCLETIEDVVENGRNKAL